MHAPGSSETSATSISGESSIPGTSLTQPEKSLRIIYAEDMPELRNVAQISFARDGHSIECVEDGASAWQKIAANPSAFDLLITDHHMPKMNGMELVARLRELPFPGKIMIFSSELSREVNNAYRRLNVDRILYKPVFPSTLRQVLQELYIPREPGAETVGTERELMD